MVFRTAAGAFGVTLADRSLRFILSSAAVHLLLAWLEYFAWRIVFFESPPLTAGRFAILWASALALAAIPAAVGSVAGGLYASRIRRERFVKLRHWLRLEGDAGAARESRMLTVLLGRAPAPRAWDYLFGSDPAGYVRMQMKADGAWVGGLFGPSSYASGFPEAPGDVYLEKAYVIEQDGSFHLGADGAPMPTGGGILIRWDEVRMLEFISMEA